MTSLFIGMCLISTVVFADSLSFDSPERQARREGYIPQEAKDIEVKQRWQSYCEGSMGNTKSRKSCLG